MQGYSVCCLTFLWLLLKLQQTVLLNKAVHNGQTYDFSGEYTKYKKTQSDSEK